MTTEKLLEAPELEYYCLLNGYSIVYNRWTDSVVFSREGVDYQAKEGVSPDEIIEAVREIPQTDVLAEFLEEIEYPDDEIQ